MISVVISIIDILSRIFILLIFIHVVLSYFMSPLHPIRKRIDQIIEPLLIPIRRLIPTVGMIDFSPLVLILLVQILNFVLRNLLGTFLY